MPGLFRKYGIQFQYPENWHLEESGEGEMPFEISAESPDGPVVSMTFFDPTSDPAEVLREYLESLQEQYEDLEMGPAGDEVAGVAGQGVEAMFYCLDFLVTAKIRWYKTDRFLVVVLEQAESREFDKHAMVFQAIKTTLLQSR